MEYSDCVPNFRRYFALIPNDYVDTVKAAIQKVREQYPLSRPELYAAYKQVCQEIRQYAQLVSPDDLRDGKTYGSLVLSPMATGIGADSRQHPYHGDIYITLWKFCEDTQLFYCKTAWDTYNQAKCPDGDFLLEI